jgi:hypothetical protein
MQTVFFVSLKGRDHFGGGGHGRIILEWILSTYILESNPHPVFGDFLNEKKKVSSRF